jgi:hypothetical protein
MAERILGPHGSKRRKRFLWVPAVLVTCLALFAIASAQAVHEFPTGLQLDGNVAHSCPPAPDTGFCASTQQDWADLFNVSTSGATQTVATNTSVVGPGGSDPDFTNATFTRDFESGSGCSLTASGGPFCTADDSTFATGSKDTLDITNGGWQCNHDNNVNSKIDIMNTYAAQYTIPAGQTNAGDTVMYFAMEKNKNNGTNDVGFWFLQGDDNCSAPSGHVNWTGSPHTIGDVLVVSEFSSGGGVSSIFAYRWVGGSNPLVQIAAASGGASDCKSAGAGDTICATTNSGAKQFNTNITTPWKTADASLGVGNTIVPPDFFEGGINISAAFRSSGSTAPRCFNTFVGDTRSSTSLTATLFDFARGKLGRCTVSMTTTPSTTSTALASSDPVTDTANLVGAGGTGTAPSPTGTVNFFLCTPSQLDGAGLCSTGGTAVSGNPVTVVPGTAPNSSATSGNVRSLITVVGTYCFRAEYDPGNDPNYKGQNAGTDNLSAECFTVTGAAHLSTAQNWLPNDTATITGDTAFSGQLTFSLYHSGDCSGTAVYTEGPTPVSGPASGATFHTNNSTFTVSLAQTNTGNYSWGVHYVDAALTSPSDSCEPSSVSITAGG